MPAKNSPHIYLSISEAETKAEVCKKSKNTKMYTVMSYFFAQQVSSLSWSLKNDLNDLQTTVKRKSYDKSINK